jgi:hypothetical protein
MGSKVFDIERLTTESEKADAQDKVAGFDENDGLGSQKFFWLGTIMTGLFIVAMATASITPYIRELGLGYVALAFTAIMLQSDGGPFLTSHRLGPARVFRLSVYRHQHDGARAGTRGYR